MALAFAAVTLAGSVRPVRAATRSAPAIEQAQVQRARLAVERGQQLYDQARYVAALEQFEAAREAYPLPDFEYNIGLCHERLENYEAAIVAFEAYLAGKPEAADRPGVQYRILQLRQAQTRGRTDRPAADTAPIFLTPHREATEDTSGASTSADDTPLPDRTSSAPAVRDAVAHDPNPATYVQEPAEGSPPRRPRRFLLAGSVLTGVGVAVGAGGGLGFGVAARRAASADRSPGPDEENGGATARADQLRTLKWVSIGVGLAVVATGVGLIIAGREGARGRPNARLVPGPTGLAVVGRF